MAKIEKSANFRDVNKISDYAKIWDQIVVNSPDAWYRHSRIFRDYTLSAMEGRNPQDLSFFIFQDNKPVGLAPLILSNVPHEDGYKTIEGGYYGIPLPWPCFVKDFKLSNEFELAVFDELEKRAKGCFVDRIQFILSPPSPPADDVGRFTNLIEERNYIDSGYLSHWIRLRKDSLSKVRPRYKRYVKKFAQNYEIKILEGSGIGDQFVDIFMDLHIKDAGGKFRSRKSYSAQVDLARYGLGFFCVAICETTKKTVGALFVILNKDQAYDGSVAIDPDHERNYVSHVLKWKTIETLLERGAKDYELGIKAQLPNLMTIPSQKNRGISFFKDGWARGQEMRISVAEKFFSRNALNCFSQSTLNQLVRHFGF